MNCTAEPKVATSAAAFIAGLSEKELSRVIDEDILPETLYDQDKGRHFWPLASALARFYFETDKDLSKQFRVYTIQNTLDKIEKSHNRALYFSLKAPPFKEDWIIQVDFGTIDISPYIFWSTDRARRVSKSFELTVLDEEILGGAPVLKGTRIPVENIVACLNAGISKEEIFASYPTLNGNIDLIEAAEVWGKINPRRGRPRKLIESNPELIMKSEKTLPFRKKS